MTSRRTSIGGNEIYQVPLCEYCRLLVHALKNGAYALMKNVDHFGRLISDGTNDVDNSLTNDVDNWLENDVDDWRMMSITDWRMMSMHWLANDVDALMVNVIAERVIVRLVPDQAHVLTGDAVDCWDCGFEGMIDVDDGSNGPAVGCTGSGGSRSGKVGSMWGSLSSTKELFSMGIVLWSLLSTAWSL